MRDVPQNPLILVLSCLGPLSLQTRTKLRNSLKGLFNYCKLQITNYLTLFVLRIAFQKKLHCAVFSFQSGLCNESYYGEYIRHLNVRIGEHIGICSAVKDHLLLCKNFLSFENFSVLTKEIRKFVLELKESFLIMRDKPSLNRNRSAPLHLFYKV